MIYFCKKLALHLGVSAATCAAVWVFSAQGRLYAGFAAGFLGAAYLLAGWLRYLKAGGTDILSRLRRKSGPQVPYFHRNDKTRTPGVLPTKRRFDYADGLEEERQDSLREIPPKLRLRAEAAAFTLCGAAMMVVSGIL